MSQSRTQDPEYVVEYVDGPLEGTIERRYLVGGNADERIGAVAAVEGLESLFWYIAGDHREVNGEKHVRYHFDAQDSDPVEADRDEESL